MNRDDLLKKCIDRGVADETSVGAVSHLFYVYLLSALQKGQRVEVPAFGTFGTRVVGVKRARKMPYFEVEQDLGEKVNERYRHLKYLVVGKYDLVPAFGEEQYKGREAPFDSLTEQIGKEKVLDTHHEISVEEYERQAAALKRPSTTREKELMPKLNLKGEEMEGIPSGPEPEPVPTPPTLRPVAESRGPSPIFQVVIALLILGGLTFALNYFGVIHLWGKKAVPPTATLPEPSLPPPVEEPIIEETPTPTPTPTPAPAQGIQPPQQKPAPAQATQPPVQKPAPTQVTPAKPKVTPPVIPSGTGAYTVQVSSWMTKAKADEEASRLAGGGFDAFVQDAVVDGVQWYRVRIGRYATQTEAAAAASDLRTKLDNGFWVAKVGR